MENKEPGRHLQIFLSDGDRTLEVDAGEDGDPAIVADTLVAALATADPEDVEHIVRHGLGSNGRVTRRSHRALG
jgi:hypothetical protein